MYIMPLLIYLSSPEITLNNAEGTLFCQKRQLRKKTQNKKGIIHFTYQA